MLHINELKKLSVTGLVARCIDGDPAAWAEFMSRFSALVYRAIRKRLQNHNFSFLHEDLEDLRQGFFTTLWKEGKLSKVKDYENIDYWIVMVAANFATDFYRRSRKDIMTDAVSIFDDVVTGRKKTALKNFISSHKFSPAAKIEKKLLASKVEQALSGLNDKEKIAVELNIFHDKKYGEISKIMKLSTGSISSIISRAKKKIKNKLQQNSGFLRIT